MRQTGVTLIEMIVAMVVVGILAALASMFGRTQIDAYFDVARRTALADRADTALRRIGRELQAALPNSVRVATSGGNSYLELVPIKDAGRYRAEGTGNPLDFSAAADSFDVLGPGVTVSAGDELVIYNLGQTGSDVYQGSNRRALSTTGSNLTSLAFSGGIFPFASPQNRFHIVGGPVTYECAGGVLRRRWGYAYASAQPTAFAAGNSAILADGVTACSIAFVAGPLTRNGLVAISLTLAEGDESVTLMHQVDILNSP